MSTICFLSCVLTALGQGAPVQVETTPVVVRNSAKTIALVGTVYPLRRSVVASEVSGFVAALPIDLGDPVEKGAELCRLRDDTRRFARDESQATLERLKAAADEAEAVRKKWEFEKKRVEGLWASRTCSEKEFQDATAEYAGAVARADAARHAADSQRAMVFMAEDNLEHCLIRAPFAGTVVAKRTEIGQWLEQGGAVAEILALDTARVRVNVPETAITFATVGESVSVQFDAIAGTFEGTISRVSPDADPKARTFPVEIDLPNPERRFKAGMFARAEFPVGERRERMAVPKDAVVRRNETTMLFVVRAGEHGSMAMPTPVQIVSEYAAQYAIEGPGLKAGDSVVIRGNERLYGPTPVMVINAPPPQASGGAATTRPTAAAAPSERPPSATTRPSAEAAASTNPPASVER